VDHRRNKRGNETISWNLMKMKTPPIRQKDLKIYNLLHHLKLLEKQEQAKSKTRRRREIIKNKGQN
jgi:hypothetical protein